MRQQLRISEVTPDTEQTWREIHNLIIPASPLSAAEVGERRQRNLLTLAHADGALVGNATVRPPADNSDISTVIVRILPEYRNQGFGTAYLAELLERPELRGVDQIATVVLVANADGLRFARHHGFVEVERYEVDGAAYADLVLSRG